jgi:hypothetical protein
MWNKQLADEQDARRKAPVVEPYRAQVETISRLDALPKRQLESLNDDDLHGRLNELELQTRALEARRLQEITAAFACGVFGLLVFVLIGRTGGRYWNALSGRSVLQEAPDGIHVDADAAPMIVH